MRAIHCVQRTGGGGKRETSTKQEQHCTTYLHIFVCRHPCLCMRVRACLYSSSAHGEKLQSLSSGTGVDVCPCACSGACCVSLLGALNRSPPACSTRRLCGWIRVFVVGISSRWIIRAREREICWRLDESREEEERRSRRRRKNRPLRGL